jgi:hypothetical protein
MVLTGKISLIFFQSEIAVQNFEIVFQALIQIIMITARRPQVRKESATDGTHTRRQLFFVLKNSKSNIRLEDFD